jgi:hypothetical protein
MSPLVCALTLTLLGSAPTDMAREGRMLFEAAPERLDARVGEWVTYQMDPGGQGTQGFMRMAIVGEEKDAQGRDSVWVELEFGDHSEMKAPLAQMLMLVAREKGLRKDGVSRLFITQGFEKLQEVDANAMPFFLGTPEKKDAPRPAPLPATAQLPAGQNSVVKRGKPSRLMTLAGTVTAEPMEVTYRNLVLKRYWISRDVPFMRLAKIEFPPIKYSMEARDFGVDAKPRIVRPAPDDKKIAMEPAANLPSWMQPLSDSDKQEARP